MPVVKFPASPSPFNFNIDANNRSSIMATNGSAGIIQPGIFEDLQKKIDEDTAVKDVGAMDIRPKKIRRSYNRRLCAISSRISRSKVGIET